MAQGRGAPVRLSETVLTPRLRTQRTRVPHANPVLCTDSASFHAHVAEEAGIESPPLSRWGNRGPERCSPLPKASPAPTHTRGPSKQQMPWVWGTRPQGTRGGPGHTGSGWSAPRWPPRRSPQSSAATGSDWPSPSGGSASQTGPRCSRPRTPVEGRGTDGRGMRREPRGGVWHRAGGHLGLVSASQEEMGTPGPPMSGGQ